MKLKKSNHSPLQGVLIKLTEEERRRIYPLQTTSLSYESELVELLGVSMVRLEIDETEGQLTVKSVSCERQQCRRCRKMCRREGDEYCDRCTASLSELKALKEQAGIK